MLTNLTKPSWLCEKLVEDGDDKRSGWRIWFYETSNDKDFTSSLKKKAWYLCIFIMHYIKLRGVDENTFLVVMS